MSTTRSETFEDMGTFLAHLEHAASVDPDDAPRVLRSLADHARRVRGSTVRCTTEMLDEGRREADRIVAQSTAQAAQLLRSGLHALDRRVDEAGQLAASSRAALDAELRVGS
jgi:predicted deacetylase